jgi:hypothetical protein
MEINLVYLKNKLILALVPSLKLSLAVFVEQTSIPLTHLDIPGMSFGHEISRRSYLSWKKS